MKLLFFLIVCVQTSLFGGEVCFFPSKNVEINFQLQTDDKMTNQETKFPQTDQEIARKTKSFFGGQLRYLIPAVVVLALITLVVFWQYNKTGNNIEPSETSTMTESETLSRKEIADLPEQVREIINIVGKDFLWLDNGKKIFTSSVYYFKKQSQKIAVFREEGEVGFMAVSMNELYKKLPPNFYRLEKNIILNQDFIKTETNHAIELKNGKLLKKPKTL